MNFFKKLLITLVILVFILIIGVFIIETKKVVQAQNQIKIYPVAYDIESSGNISWQNPQNAFNQNLSNEASILDFNKDNSAYIAETDKAEEIIPATTTTTTLSEETTATTTIPEETTSTTIPEETTTTTTTIPEETTTTTTTIPEETTTTTTTIPEETTTTTNETTTTTEPVSIIKKFLSWFSNKAQAEESISNPSSLIFSDFSLGDFDLDKKIIQNVQLRVSFAGLGHEGDKVNIDYFYNNEWRNLGEINLSQEASNNTNGGYFLFALPIFSSLDDFQNLKIKFTYDKPGVYLDAAWLEANYEPLTPQETNNLPLLSKPQLKSHFLNKKVEISKASPHRCEADNFTINISNKTSASLKILLKGKKVQRGELEIGNLPYGIDITFTQNQNYLQQISQNDNVLDLKIINQEGSQKGSFNIPILYTDKENNQTTVCQINIINF